MAQTATFVIANEAGASVRARLNQVIAALQSANAGSVAPTTTLAGMLWLDTSGSPPVLRRRNATDTGWDAVLDAAGNLAGLSNVATARTNLGLGTMATKSAASYDAILAGKASLAGDTFTGVVTAPNFVSSSDARLKGEHKIGHVAEFDAIALDTATHFAFREECMSCPVVQLCKGSCMFLEGEFFKQSCANEFAFNMGVLMAAVWHLTGMVVVGVATGHSV